MKTGKSYFYLEKGIFLNSHEMKKYITLEKPDWGHLLDLTSNGRSFF